VPDLPIKQIAIIAQTYPTSSKPYAGAFIEQLVLAFARMGVSCVVINPVKWWMSPPMPVVTRLECAGASLITVIRPRYISFSSKQVGKFNTIFLTRKMFDWAALRTVQSLPNIPDVFYGHFLSLAGRASVKLGKKFGRPAFVAVGESVENSQETIWSLKTYSVQCTQKDFRYVTGVITVSNLLKQKILNQLDIDMDRIRVIPNGVDLSIFYPRDKRQARQALGLPLNKFIAIFVGGFDDRKGVLRLLEAVSGLDDKVGLVLLGDGPLQPDSASILYKGKVHHQQVVNWLSASDVFVLPTLAEGSNNSILEALACGLPVISSDGEFNNDILNNSVSLRIDSQNISAIRASICKLRDDCGLRETMSKNAVVWARKFDINLRSKRMLEWMSQFTV
jgi:glycosyltransferase involved in cell wall biosynthesis